jgi:hypothetical protein
MHSKISFKKINGPHFEKNSFVNKIVLQQEDRIKGEHLVQRVQTFTENVEPFKVFCPLLYMLIFIRFLPKEITHNFW